MVKEVWVKKGYDRGEEHETNKGITLVKKNKNDLWYKWH